MTFAVTIATCSQRSDSTKTLIFDMVTCMRRQNTVAATYQWAKRELSTSGAWTCTYSDQLRWAKEKKQTGRLCASTLFTGKEKICRWILQVSTCFHCLIGWLAGRLVDWLADWLLVILVNWLTDWLADWLVGRRTGRLAGWQDDWLTNWQLLISGPVLSHRIITFITKTVLLN